MNEFLIRGILVSPFLLVLLIRLSNMMLDIVTNLWELFLNRGIISPLVKLLVNVSLAIFDGIFSVKSSLHLYWIGKSAIVEIQDCETSWQRGRWLEIVSEVDLWEGLLEVIDILNLVVVGLDILIS